MALFGSSKEKKSSLKKVRPTVVRTQNVAKELVNLAKSYEINVSALDFNILEVQTFTRMNDGSKETDWEEVSSEELYELDDKTALLNQNFQIKQMYEIEIFSKDREEDKYEDFHVAVGANATKCKVYLSIKEGSKISYNPRLEPELLMLVNKSKVRAGVLINIFDEMLHSSLSKLCATIRVEENLTFEKNQTILIAESYEPTLTTNDELMLHFEKKEDIDDNSKIDYKQRGFIKNVHKGELLIEYKKSKEGKPGRDCSGEFIKPNEPQDNNTPNFTVDETIEQKETDEKIEYFANENGYIAFEGGVYSIQSEMGVDQISFKTTGSISTGLDSDVSISVKETDAIKDAIGSGMDVEVTEINIEGNVGSNATLNAIRATIQGQTHKTATLKADNLKINIHKGTAYGKNIDVTRLEHGTIDGEIVKITQAIGGDIRAKELTIELCGSYVNATASRFIEIRKLHGSENVFTIDPLLTRASQGGFSENTENIKKLERAIKNLEQEIDRFTQQIEDGTANFNNVKKRLVHYKKNGVKMPESFVKQYKQFQKMQAHLETIQVEYAQKKDQLTLLTTRTASFQDNIFDARIINRDKWEGYNELKFKLVDPPVEISYKPPIGCADKVFGLVELEDGAYEIQAVKE